jgi:hypothetical protein
MDLKSDTSMSYSASPHLEDEGIYVFEEDAIDLQLELAVVRKQLRSTELAYRALVRLVVLSLSKARLMSGLLHRRTST